MSSCSLHQESPIKSLSPPRQRTVGVRRALFPPSSTMFVTGSA